MKIVKNKLPVYTCSFKHNFKCPYVKVSEEETVIEKACIDCEYYDKGIKYLGCMEPAIGIILLIILIILL